MSRLIDADALLRDIEHYHLSDGKFQHWVEIQPTIEPKKGKWILPNNPIAKANDEWICSGCHYLIGGKHNYCPNCGSDMRGEE